MLHKALQNKWARVLIAVFATFLYALGVNLFVVPMGLYSGGVVGLSQIIRTLLAQAVELPAGVDIAGILYFLINIPVLYLAWRDLGRAFLIRTLICVGASSLFLSSAVTALTHRLSAVSLMSSSILKSEQALDEIEQRADLPHEQHHRRDETGQAHEHCLIRTVRAHEQLIEHGDDDAHRCDLKHEVNIHRRLPYVKRLSFSITL